MSKSVLNEVELICIDSDHPEIWVGLGGENVSFQKRVSDETSVFELQTMDTACLRFRQSIQ